MHSDSSSLPRKRRKSYKEKLEFTSSDSNDYIGPYKPYQHRNERRSLRKRKPSLKSDIQLIRRSQRYKSRSREQIMDSGREVRIRERSSANYMIVRQRSSSSEGVRERSTSRDTRMIHKSSDIETTIRKKLNQTENKENELPDDPIQFTMDLQLTPNIKRNQTKIDVESEDDGSVEVTEDEVDQDIQQEIDDLIDSSVVIGGKCKFDLL